MTADVLTVGEPLVCFAPDLDEPGVYRRSLGGAEVNTAVGLARLGHRVELLADVGTDPHGDFLIAALEAERVGIGLVGRDPQRQTGVLIKERNGDDDPWIRYARTDSPATAMDVGALTSGMVEGRDLVHFTGVFLALGAGPDALARSIARSAWQSGVPVSFDVNFRPTLLDGDRLAERVRSLLPWITHLFCNEEEAALLTGRVDSDEALGALHNGGPRTVIIKRGAHGATALIDGVRFDVPAVQVAGPIDTVGAGDAFNAGWLHGWLTCQTPIQAMSLGAFTASHVVMHPSDHGGFPPAEAVTAELSRLSGESV